MDTELETFADRPETRWQVIVSYKTTMPSYIFFVDELEEIQDEIEKGPSFLDIEEISITYTL